VQTAPLTLPGCNIDLQEVFEGVNLNRKQVWHLNDFFNLAKRTPFDTSVCLCQSPNSLLLVKAKAHGATDPVPERQKANSP
jgi:hypothetical protein